MFSKTFTNVEIKFFKKQYADCWLGKNLNKYVILFSTSNFFFALKFNVWPGQHKYYFLKGNLNQFQLFIFHAPHLHQHMIHCAWRAQTSNWPYKPWPRGPLPVLHSPGIGIPTWKTQAKNLVFHCRWSGRWESPGWHSKKIAFVYSKESCCIQRVSDPCE